MTSQINPNNIDGNYPVAGIANNTQGFRDNFTNIQTNFQYAEDEINELQTKSLLKAAITGSTLDNNMNDNLLYAAKIQDFSATLVQVTATAGSVAIDYAAGHYQTLSTTGAISLSFANFPVSGSVGQIRLSVNITSTAHTLTFPSAVSVNNQGIQGLNTANNTITFAATGLYDFEFVTRDGGTTIIVSEVNKRILPFNNSSEDLAPAAAANLALTTSYFTTAGSETATLAAGVSGQIKVFAAADVTAGNMVITVANAGWKTSGSGTIVFDARGDACTLQYIDSKWFCIGNNGCTFA